MSFCVSCFRSRFFPALAGVFFCFFGFLMPGIYGKEKNPEVVSLRADPEKTVHRIDEKVYGHFLEHIYHSINGGLWGDLIWNRSFEDVSGGQWSRSDDTVSQSSTDNDIRLLFGEQDWGAYGESLQFTLEAKKTGGAEGFLVIFRAKNDEEFYWANLGGWSNTQHAVERKSREQQRQGIIGPITKGSIEKDRWYEIKVRCEGTKIEIFLDGKKILELTDAQGPKNGQVGIGTWGTKAQFRNMKVETLDGKTLFEGLPPLNSSPKISKHWEVFGDATAYLESQGSLNGNYHQRITVPGRSSEYKRSGIQQRGITLEKGETYILTYWVKCDSANEPIHALGTGLYTKENSVVCGFSTVYTPQTQWTQVRKKLISNTDATDAVLRLDFDVHAGKTANIRIDQISLMPLSWKETYGGMRPDLLRAIADLRPPVIRWPGGCFASAYRWKDGIGAQHKRGPYPFSIWDDREVNSFGTDEFIELCRRVGSQPIIVVNGGTPNWNSNRNPELADVDWPQEAADWVEYCNGPVNSKWGSVRAENGHPAPYNVKYWEIDNETQGGVKVEEYIEIIRKTVTAMKRIDPGIKIAVAGSHYYPREPWDRPIIEQAGELFDYLSFHQYDDPQKYASGPAEIETYFRKLKEIIAGSQNPNIRIYDSEWNAQSTDWRTGLYAGGMLNMFERNADILEIGGPALFLRHVGARDWDNAFINFDAKSWFAAPNYVVMKLWREHYAPNLLELSGAPGDLSVVATKSEDGKTFYLKAVNPTDLSREISFQLPGKRLKNAEFQRIRADSLRDRNTLENPDAIQPEPGEVSVVEDCIRFELLPLSLGIVKIE